VTSCRPAISVRFELKARHSVHVRFKACGQTCRGCEEDSRAKRRVPTSNSPPLALLIRSAQISIPPDLQSLCLVSREWNFVATEFLYKKIFLHSRGEHDQLLRFENCLRIGATKFLRHTRSLSLYDTTLFDERCLRYKYAYREEGAMDEIIARQEAILRVMQLFPQHRLITFR
jgi:hypothetical protein